MAGDDTDREIERLLRAQSGVISRDQVIAAGGRPSRIVRMLAHQDWARMMDGVYVGHTGRPTWRQRAWAGVLRYQPAALGGHAALRAAVPDWRHHRDARPITLVVARGRHLTPAAGYRFRRVSDLGERVQWHTSPPRQRVEHSVIDLTSVAATEFGAIGLLADACQSGGVTPERTAEVLRARRRVPRKEWLLEVLDDLACGTTSVLEHGYLTRVERPHGLPAAHWQRPDLGPDGAIRRDADYDPYALVVELNGRIFHDDAQHYDSDLERDLDTLVAREGVGRLTARLGWGQVFDRPCRTADSIATLLRGLGWDGNATRCRDCGP